MVRADVLLVKLKIAPSRTKAQDLIRAGTVEFLRGNDWIRIEDPSIQFDQSVSADSFRIHSNEILKYVSRAGLKLEMALLHLKLNIKDYICIDCGQSTGGFTDCLLHFGARHVVGFDVGHGQLSALLRNHPQVTTLEGINIRNINENEMMTLNKAKHHYDLAVMDLSFISIKVGLQSMVGWAPLALCLVKPQFELGPAALNKKGVVKSQKMYADLQVQIEHEARRMGWQVLDYFPCSVLGKDGNQEFFIFLKNE